MHKPELVPVPLAEHFGGIRLQGISPSSNSLDANGRDPEDCLVSRGEISSSASFTVTRFTERS